MKTTSNLWRFYIEKYYSESKSNIISINLNQSNNYCICSLKQRFSLALNYLLSLFFMLFTLHILTLKNPNTVLYYYIQDNPIFTSIIYYFCHNTLCMDLNPSSISESLAISLALEWKVFDRFFSYSLRLVLSKLQPYSGQVGETKRPTLPVFLRNIYKRRNQPQNLFDFQF